MNWVPPLRSWPIQVRITGRNDRLLILPPFTGYAWINWRRIIPDYLSLQGSFAYSAAGLDKVLSFSLMQCCAAYTIAFMHGRLSHSF